MNAALLVAAVGCAAAAVVAAPGAAFAAPPLAAPPAAGGAPRPLPAAGGAARPFGCLIEPDRVAEVGSQVVGVVERLAVERGDAVVAGQPLLTLRADVERAHAGVARTRAEVDADVNAAKASVELAQQKVTRAEALVAQKFVSTQALEQARGELELSQQKLSQVRSQQAIWAQEQRVAEAQLAMRTVRSPFAGVVVERYVSAGERVEERPVIRVAVIDPLRVELMVPTVQYGTVARGDRLTIRPELPGADGVVATVTHVDRVLDAASNTFRVRLTLPNAGQKLPAGLRCRADLPATQAAQAPVARDAGPPRPAAATAVRQPASPAAREVAATRPSAAQAGKPI